MSCQRAAHVILIPLDQTGPTHATLVHALAKILPCTTSTQHQGHNLNRREGAT